MLSFLIISNDSKVENLVDSLRPMVKASIAAVADFDHGLKDVFEKRPALVIIQEVIVGVTGESVARHIQLLFGADAPKFILLHEGNQGVSAIPGLFEHVVDLSQSEERLIQDILAAMRRLLGTEWEKPSGGQFAIEKDGGPGDDFFVVERNETLAVSPGGAGQPEIQTRIEPVVVTQLVKPFPEKEYAGDIQPGAMDVEREKTPPDREKGQENSTAPEPARTIGIRKEPDPAPGKNTEDIVKAFNANYRAQKNRKTPALLILLVLAVAGCLLLQRCALPELFSAKPKAGPPPTSPIVQKPAGQPSAPSVTQRKMSSASAIAPAAFSQLPTFVVPGSRDKSFSDRKPGWEHYPGSGRDVRLFRQAGRIKALQVIAGQGRSIDDGLLKTALKEVAGSDAYGAMTQRKQGRLLLQSARVGGHADLLIYRDERGKDIKAFVISVD